MWSLMMEEKDWYTISPRPAVAAAKNNDKVTRCNVHHKIYALPKYTNKEIESETKGFRNLKAPGC